MQNDLQLDFKRFDESIYAVAQRNEVDALPLLSALESSSSVSMGVMSLLSLVRSQCALAAGNPDLPSLFSSAKLDDLLALCITSLDLLNTKIESVADLLAVRYEAERPAG